jgi:hypothetical protein
MTKVRYFYLDELGRLHKVAQRHMEAVWYNERPWDDAKGTKLLRVISFICDDDFRPRHGFAMRVRIEEGRLTKESRNEAIAAVQSGMPSLLEPAPTEFLLIDKQLESWPEPNSVFRQLAVPWTCRSRASNRSTSVGHCEQPQGEQALTYYDIDESE